MTSEMFTPSLHFVSVFINSNIITIIIIISNWSDLGADFGCDFGVILNFKESIMFVALE